MQLNSINFLRHYSSHIDTGAVAYAQTLAPRAYHPQEHHDEIHEHWPGRARAHARGSIRNDNARKEHAHVHGVRPNVRPNPEKAFKLGGFLKSKGTKAKKALQRIWRKVTGKH